MSSVSLSASLSTLLALGVLLLIAGILVLDDRLGTLLGGLLGSSPLRGTGPLGLLPGTHIGKLAATSTLARTAELDGQVLSRDLGQQLLLVSATENVDLVNGDGVEEGLDSAEHAAEAPGSIDQVELAQTLGIVVLGDIRGLLNVAVDGGDAGDADALQVHDCAAGLQQLAGLARAGGQAGVGQLLILGH